MQPTNGEDRRMDKRKRKNRTDGERWKEKVRGFCPPKTEQKTSWRQSHFVGIQNTLCYPRKKKTISRQAIGPEHVHIPNHKKKKNDFRYISECVKRSKIQNEHGCTIYLR